MKTRDCAFLFLLAGVLFLVSCSVGGAQSAARGAFEEWAQEAGIPYTDVGLETLSDDGTFATVRVTALFRESAEGGWHEMQADIECRQVAGEWECNQYLHFTLSETERERIAQAQEATDTAILTTESMTPAPPAPATPMAGEELRLIAAEIRQEPSEAGYQQYSVRLVFENHGSRFEPLPGEDILRGGTVTTADGYSYPVQVATDTGCRWPREVDAVIPPGFRLRGLVLYDYTVETSCRSELWAEFEVGAALVPATINLGTYVIDLRSPPQALQYPLIAGPPQLESLPITRLVGSMEVHIGPAEAGPVSTLIDLQYRNTDSAYSHEIVDPVVEIIDDEGWLTSPSLAAGLGWTEPVCPYTVGAAEELGPLQTAMYQSCVLELPRQGEAYYLVIASDSGQLTVHGGTYQPSQRLLQAAFERGMAAYATDDWIGAARAFEEMLLIQPDHPEASTRLEQIRQGLGTISYVDDDVVYAVSPLGGQPVELLSLDGKPQALEWSPDYNSVAYISDGQLIVVRRDGSNPRTIVEGDAYDFDDLAWSPDQQNIAYTPYHKGLWSVGIEDRIARPLTCTADYTPVRTEYHGLPMGQPSFSPHTLYFVQWQLIS